MVRVRGVGMPALCSRNVVADLSTQRSMARASFHTRTPLSRKACRRPRRKVICSSVPCEIERTNTASGSSPSKPGISMPLSSCVSKAQRGSELMTTEAPRARSASARRRTCQLPLSSSRKSATRSPLAAASAEAFIDDVWSKFARMERGAGVEVGNDHLGGAEQHGIDFIEVAAGRRENLGKRQAVGRARRARQLLRQLLRRLISTAHEQLYASTVDDGVVGAAHGADEIRNWRRDRRGADAVLDMLERKVQLVRFVQRNLKDARGDLHGAGEAARRGVEDGEIGGLHATGSGD